MKKIWKSLASALCLATAFSAVACGPKPVVSNSGGAGDDDIHASERLYTIKVAVSNAGFGLEWAKKLAKE